MVAFIGRLSAAACIAALALTQVQTRAHAQATPDQKMETCNFGADNQKLTGAKRKAFMAKCMSNKDSPRGKVAPGR